MVRALLSKPEAVKRLRPDPVGLAAPQVGQSLRLITIDLMPDDKPAPLTLINPEIVALAEPNETLRGAALAQAPEAISCIDWREVIDNRDVDAVVIALPTSLHAEAAIAALGAGKHIYLEKPIAATLAALSASGLIACGGSTPPADSPADPPPDRHRGPVRGAGPGAGPAPALRCRGRFRCCIARDRPA